MKKRYAINQVCLTAGFFILLQFNAAAQNQHIADSLAVIYKSGVADDSARFELLRNLSFNEVNDLRLSLQYAEELIDFSKKRNNNIYLHRGYLQKGNKKRLMGNMEEALDAYFKSVTAAERERFYIGIGTAYSAIADIYSIAGNHANAMTYYNKAIDNLRRTNDSVMIGTAIFNAGDEYLNVKQYDSALVYCKEAASLFEKLDYRTGQAYCIGNIGMVYANIGKRELAEININNAIDILNTLEDYYPVCVYLLSMCDIYRDKKEFKTAIGYAERSLQLAFDHGLKEQISDADLKLSKLYESIGDLATSYRFYKNHIVYRDSVSNVKSVQRMADLRTNYEVSQKQSEVNLLNEEKKNQRILSYLLFAILGLITIILATLYYYYRSIAKEKKRSEKLLLNILPAQAATELKNHGKVEAVKFENVTVLFTDFVQFTALAERIPPEQLVTSIDYYFRMFDEIITRHGLEKIKTIGDAYMCAGGLPITSNTHAKSALLAAKEILAAVENALTISDGNTHFEIRIGLHTGPVIAGIVGIKKWQYDIWGDTVNIASRMESKSSPGRINISDTTYQLVKDDFDCEYRGEIEVKNRGALKMYFVN